MENYAISLYTDTGVKKEYNIDNYFDEGEYGYIYKLDDNTCLKLFSDNFFFDDTVLRVIKSMKLNNFYEIYDLLYDCYKNFCGYTMKYYPSEDINIVDMPTSYTLDNLYGLYKSFERLSDNCIVAYDCYNNNIIINNSGLTVIDVDLFYREANKRRENYYNLMDLFKILYHNELRKLGYPMEDREKILDSLFNEKKDITQVEKKLIKYKYPIDYIKDCYRGKC